MKAAFYYYKAYLANLYKDWMLSRTWFIRYLLKSGLPDFFLFLCLLHFQQQLFLSFFSLFLSSFKLSR